MFESDNATHKKEIELKKQEEEKPKNREEEQPMERDVVFSGPFNRIDHKEEQDEEGDD
jgi:hypothetical protein